MHILVVDDHAMFAESIKILLGADHDISMASNGTEAIAAITTQKPAVVLLDINLPDIDGLTLLKVIQALPAPPGVLVVSGAENMQLANEARRAGAAGFLHKSLPAEALLQAIKKIESGENAWPEADSITPETNESKNRSDELLQFNRLVVEQLGITNRQMDVFTLLAQGDPNKTIARKLGIAESTVKHHLKMLFQSLNVNNRVACHNKMIELGILDTTAAKQ
ncbi:hypothetical protein AB833_21575 [Chromatiales bacterium (ex Bugula neritina AB1)]|nr:hypothetical protein AB833_21575 [Chromatiales bacterium (ex Bugula neritina AB1)]